MKRQSQFGSFLLLVIGVFITALVGFIDYHVMDGVIRQIGSTSYPTTDGHITFSALTRSHSSKGGTTYGVDLRYRYSVAGQSFEGKRFRYNAGSSSDSAWARRAVNAHPVNSAVTVIYNPRDPSDALLSPGLDGSDLTLVLFLTPFTLLMLAVWYAGATALRWNFAPPVAGGVKIVRDGFHTRVRLAEFSALLLSMAVLGVAAFLLTFVLLLSSGFHPPLATAAAAICVAYGAGAAAYIWQSRKIQLGGEDLILDESARCVELPATFHRRERMTVGIANIAAVTIEAREHRSRKGAAYSTYAPTLQLKGAAAVGETLAEWRNEKQAESFATWLREQLALPPAIS